MACVYKVKHLIKDETEFGRVSTKAWHYISVPPTGRRVFSVKCTLPPFHRIQTFENTLFRLEFANSCEANRGLACQTSSQSGIQTHPKRHVKTLKLRIWELLS